MRTLSYHGCIIFCREEEGGVLGNPGQRAWDSRDTLCDLLLHVKPRSLINVGYQPPGEHHSIKLANNYLDSANSSFSRLPYLYQTLKCCYPSPDNIVTIYGGYGSRPRWSRDNVLASKIQGSLVQTRPRSMDFFQDVQILSTSPPDFKLGVPSLRFLTR